MSRGTRWVAAIFGVLFVVAAGICFASPQDTFAALADSRSVRALSAAAAVRACASFAWVVNVASVVANGVSRRHRLCVIFKR